QKDRGRCALDDADQVVDVAFALGDRSRDPRPRPSLVVQQLAPDREIARPGEIDRDRVVDREGFHGNHPLTSPRRRLSWHDHSVATSGYSGTPLPQKLGIKEAHKVAILGAPA